MHQAIIHVLLQYACTSMGIGLRCGKYIFYLHWRFMSSCRGLEASGFEHSDLVTWYWFLYRNKDSCTNFSDYFQKRIKSVLTKKRICKGEHNSEITCTRQKNASTKLNLIMKISFEIKQTSKVKAHFLQCSKRNSSSMTTCFYPCDSYSHKPDLPLIFVNSERFTWLFRFKF